MRQVGDQEQDFLEDWGEVRRVAGVFFRHPRAILSMTAIITAAVVVVTMSRAPLFRTSLTLKLDDENARNPILEDLDIPTGTVDAEEAATRLRSSSLLRTLIATPSDGELAHPGHPEYTRRMGLTTIVEDTTIGTIRGYADRILKRSSPDFRVFAQLTPVEDGAPEMLLMRFRGPDRVELRIPEGYGRASWPEGTVAVVDFEPGLPFEVHGVQLRVSTMGMPDQREFRVLRLTEDEAVAWVADRIGVAEMPDEANTVLVSVDDTDAARAVELANALSLNFLEYDAQRTRERAQEIVEYIESELGQRTDELARFNTGISRILETYPDAIDVQKGYLRLSEQLSAVQARHQSVTRLRESLQEMDTEVRAGKRAMASRLGQQLDDPLTRKYLDYIATLSNERLRVDRDGVDQHQRLLSTKHADSSDLLHKATGRLKSIDELIANLTAGDLSALGRIGGGTGPAEMTSIGALTHQYAADYVKASEELDLLELEFTPEYYLVTAKRKQMEGLHELILAHLRSRRDSIALEVDHTQELVDRWTDLLEARPDSERLSIDTALESLWTQVENALAARIAGLLQEGRSLQHERDDLELRIADLPQAQRMLKEPELDRAALESVVTKLTEKKELAAVAAAGAVPTVELLSRARLPRGPLSPSLHLGLAIGLLLGAVFSVGSCLLHENFRGQMRSESDYRDLGGVPLFATIKGSLGVASFESSNREIADGFRTLRARLRVAERQGHPARTVAVTSSLPGEGKTAANVALAMAYSLEGRRVLLIDGNLLHPEVHEHLELPPGPGLAEALDGRKHWMQCTRPTGIPRLDVLVAGSHYYAPADLLSGVAMEKLLEEVDQIYDVAVLDLPNVEGCPDVACVGPLLDNLLLLCCEEGGPTRRHLLATIDSLAAAGTPVAGLVRQLHRPRASRAKRSARSRVAA